MRRVGGRQKERNMESATDEDSMQFRERKGRIIAICLGEVFVRTEKA